MSLRDHLNDLAGLAPTPALPSGFANRVRRRHRWRQAAAAAAVLVLLTVPVAYFMRPGPDAQPAATDPALPDRLAAPPWWTADAVERPIGAAAAAFTGDSVPGRALLEIDAYNPATALTGLNDDTYRILHEDGRLLSPDGRYLIVGHDKRPYDLGTGRPLSDIRDVQAISADGRFYANGHSVYRWDGSVELWNYRGGGDVVAAAVSADGNQVASTNASGEIAVHRRDPAARDEWGVDGATLMWRSSLPLSLIAGTGAFTPDGQLAVLTYASTPCWSLLGRGPVPAEAVQRCTARVELLDATTGTPVARSYPVVTGALGMQVVGWRGDTAYATRSGDYGNPRADLIRLDPETSEPVVVMDTPPGTSSLTVATAYLGSSRPAGSVDTGFSWSAAADQALWWAVVAGIPVAVLVGMVTVVVQRSRRRRRLRRDP
jgi:hypothetical protein